MSDEAMLVDLLRFPLALNRPGYYPGQGVSWWLYGYRIMFIKRSCGAGLDRYFRRLVWFPLSCSVVSFHLS